MFGQQLFNFDDDLMVQSVKTEKKKTNKTKKKQKYEDIMKKLPQSCFSCTAHPTEYLRLVPEPSINLPTCKSCGFKCSGKLGYLVCSKTSGCYSLCSSCKVCSSNHILRKMHTLKHLTGNTLYENNKFKCHGCKDQKQVSEKKCVYHCSTCSFDICSQCMERTANLWQQKEQALEIKNKRQEE